MIEKIEHKGNLIALILRRDFGKEGTNFVTSPENPLQVGILKYRKGFEIKPHIHMNVPRNIDSIQEVLHIQSGRIEATFYSDDDKISSTILEEGDTILLVSGGHGFNILEDSKMIEVKQGPYSGVEKDKKYLE